MIGTIIDIAFALVVISCLVDVYRKQKEVELVAHKAKSMAEASKYKLQVIKQDL